MTAIIFDTETHDKEEPEIIEASWWEVEFGNPTTGSPFNHCFRYQPSKPTPKPFSPQPPERIHDPRKPPVITKRTK